MDFGIGLTSGVDAWKTAKRAEELGFTHVWVVDTQMLCADVFVAMALVAAHTTRIRIGTGVVIPSNRIAPVTANALASVAKLAPGRIDFGVGTGFTGRNTLGLPAMRLADLREHVRVIQALLRGETVEWEGDGRRRKIRFLNPDAGLIDIGPKIPLHLSAFGPRARALTAEIADGWMHFAGRLSAGLRDLAAIGEACRAAGRAPESLYKTTFTMGCVLRDGEPADAPRARAQAGPFAMTVFHSLMDGSLPMRAPTSIAADVPAYQKLYESYEPADARYLTLHRGHFMFLRPEEERFATAAALREMTFTATLPELRDRVRALRDGGADQFAVFLAPAHEDAIEDWARVVEKV
jgi:5,10-methylenetetrahydromethanopterin reductase